MMISNHPANTRLLASLAILVCLTWLAEPYPASAAPELSQTIVISQIYGGGGNTGAPFTHDYIELFNRGTTAVNIAGWSVQYATSSGATWQITQLAGVIQPGRYYLIQEAGGVNGIALPTPDANGSIGMGAVSGKVALLSNTTLLSGSCPSTGAIVDLVGYGSTATCSETSPTDVASNFYAVLRKTSGCTETDNNNNDFWITSPNPRNSGSPTFQCLARRLFFPLIARD